MHRRRRPVPGARRLDLRRRAPDLQGDRGRRRGLPRAAEDDRALHERAEADRVPRRLQARPAPDLRRPPRRHARDPRLRLRLPGPLGHRRRRDQAGARGRLPRHDEHDHLQGDLGRGRDRDDGLPDERGRDRRDADLARLPVLADRPGADDDPGRARARSSGRSAPPSARTATAGWRARSTRTSSPATGSCRARRGARSRATRTAGRARATCSRTGSSRPTRRCSRTSSGSPTGRATTRAASTAGSTPGSSRRPRTRRPGA